MTNAYRDLIIKQYFYKPKARAEIGLVSGAYEVINRLIKSLPERLDIDNAIGVQLDLIGRILNIPRQYDNIVINKFFGFHAINSNALRFDSKFSHRANNISHRANRGHFFSKFESKQYLPITLNDVHFRMVLKAKILRDTTSSLPITHQDRKGINNAVNDIFGGDARVTDNYDMTIDFVCTRYDKDVFKILMRQDLLPRPKGVRYDSRSG